MLTIFDVAMPCPVTLVLLFFSVTRYTYIVFFYKEIHMTQLVLYERQVRPVEINTILYF